VHARELHAHEIHAYEIYTYEIILVNIISYELLHLNRRMSWRTLGFSIFGSPSVFELLFLQTLLQATPGQTIRLCSTFRDHLKYVK
jgi:hypothetical protein